MESFSFGDSPEMADALLELVIQGRKTATSWAAVHGMFGSEVGVRQVIKDGRERPRVVIEITELTLKPFSQVDDAFARDEGEGDLSLDFWREAHWRFFSRTLGKIGKEFALEMPLVCERFRVIYKP